MLTTPKPDKSLKPYGYARLQKGWAESGVKRNIPGALW